MILVDTSVWIDHLRRRNAILASVLDQGQVVCHPFVMGELAVGHIKGRAAVLGLLANLHMARVVRHEEALALVEGRGLAGRGIGWIDAHLVAAALVDRLTLWTLDRRLADVARELDVAWDGPVS